MHTAPPAFPFQIRTHNQETLARVCQSLSLWINHIVTCSTSVNEDLLDLHRQLRDAPLFFLDLTYLSLRLPAHMPVVGIGSRCQTALGDVEYWSHASSVSTSTAYGTFLLLESRSGEPLLYNLEDPVSPNRISLFCPQQSISLQLPAGLIRHIGFEDGTRLDIPVWPKHFQDSQRISGDPTLAGLPPICMAAAQLEQSAIHSATQALVHAELLPPSKIDWIQSSTITVTAHVDTQTNSGNRIIVNMTLQGSPHPAPPGEPPTKPGGGASVGSSSRQLFTLRMDYALADTAGSTFGQDLVCAFLLHYARKFHLREVVERAGYIPSTIESPSWIERYAQSYRLPHVATATVCFHWQWRYRNRILIYTRSDAPGPAGPWQQAAELATIDPLPQAETPEQAKTQINNLLEQVQTWLAEYSSRELHC